MQWRLILDGFHGGAWNMAADEALVDAVDARRSPPVLRLYRWRPPCLSLGFSQPYDVADAEFCASHGVDVVRRPTGGRAVLHHLELTYSVLAALGQGPFSQDLQASYQLICRALVAGLRKLGVPARVSGEPEGGHISPTEAIPCFIGPAAGEVVAHGRKLVGSAMRRQGGSILQHGSILEGWDGALQAGCLGLQDDASLRSAVTTLSDLLGAPPLPEVLCDAVAAGFAETLGANFVPSTLTAEEVARARLLERERYGHERWTVRRDGALPVGR
ncbi:MAG TPA: lipoate--protein ligase family protein [Thermoanaerobaculaceae bacterium]|nr:lipoate--protein ligase family protein [Thermoanaerobaculaceae bacterium]